MAIGTNGNDTLATTADFEFIASLDGNDSITSTHNFGVLAGGADNDTLSTTLVSFAAQVSVTQLGGGGNDSLTFNYTQSPTFASPIVTAVQDGGTGNDTLTAVIPSTPQRTTTSSALITGGYGADQIFVGINADDALAPDTELVIDAGIGDDEVLSASATSYNGGGTSVTSATATVVIDLGNGDDTLFGASASTLSEGTNTATLDIQGRAGADTITGFLTTSSWIFQTGGSATMAQTIDGGTGDDSITATFRSGTNYVLDSVIGTSNLSGGNGADTLSSTVVLNALILIDFDEIISTGAGNDSVTLDHDLAITPGAGTILHNTITNLGGSNDTLTANVDILDVSTAVSVNSVTSLQGFNTINLTTNVTAFSFANINNSVTTGGNADSINVVATSFMAQDATVSTGNYAEARNSITSGGGNDTLDASATALSSGDALSAGTPRGGVAGNTINAGGGADDITAATIIAAEFANTGTLRAAVNISGGTGKDTITSTIDTPALSPANIDVSNFINGDEANDVIISNITLDAATAITGVSQLSGGSGSDQISSNVNLNSSGTAAISLAENIFAGAGHDTITTTLDTSGAPTATGLPTYFIVANAGNDVISANVIGPLGIFSIFGGNGDDLITVTSTNTPGFDSLQGGAGNDTLISGNNQENSAGGAGQDRLVASMGADNMYGGDVGGNGDGEADTFVFDPTLDNDTNFIKDWERSLDILEFTGLIDAGAPGLADDIDALTAVADLGPGNSVIFTFFGTFTSMHFEGQGTGAITSIADLVDDPLSQLIA